MNKVKAIVEQPDQGMVFFQTHEDVWIGFAGFDEHHKEEEYQHYIKHINKGLRFIETNWTEMTSGGCKTIDVTEEYQHLLEA